MWIKDNFKPKKLDRYQKVKISGEVERFIKKSEKLSKSVNRIAVKSGRVYLYHLVEQFGWDDPESKFIKPLIDGKYAEFPYARITIYDNEYSLDWQRHNDKWATVFTGSLQECLQFMDETGGWFE
ncbi:MAG: hypothetical protein KAV44_02455 [Bacteroidales bacterium]|nr:hypothetical protein [Bacteroidales bacterium]